MADRTASALALRLEAVIDSTRHRTLTCLPARTANNASFRRSAAAALIGNALFAAFLLIRPFPREIMTWTGDIALTLGLLATVALCFLRPRQPDPALPRSNGKHDLVPALLGVGLLFGALTAALFGYYDLIRHHVIPLGSAADVTFVIAHPFALPTLLLLPTTRLSGLVRIRHLVDGLLVLAAVTTFGWYCLVGPIFLDNHLSMIATISQTAYPASDLFLIACLLVLSTHFTSPTMRLPAGLLTAGLTILFITDCLFDYQRLHDLYSPASLLDAGWFSGATLVGLAALALRAALTRHHSAVDPALSGGESRPLHLLRSLVPYALVLAVIFFTLFLWTWRPHDRLALSVYVGTVAIVLLAFLRQFLAIIESAQLIHHLRLARDDVQARNRSLAEANVQFELLATHDSLTGLPNRSLFRDRLDHALAHARRHGSSLAVGVVDLDSFKLVNDSLGHPQGDALLGQIAQRLQSLIRECDTVARLGGDEFALILLDVDEPQAGLIAARVLRCINQPVMLDGRALSVGASIGLAIAPQHGDDVATLLQHADIAMYHAKHTGAGSACYDPAHDHHTPDQITLASELRRAIECSQLVLHFQPKVDLATDAIPAAEALIRWQHPVLGLVPPAQFIPLAERSGLIGPLTEWVLQTAHQQWLTWRAQNIHLLVAVNLSARSLYDPRLMDVIAELAGRTTTPWLQVEITESSLIADPERAMHVLNRVRALGVQIAIDDFGTGYSSLAYLRRLPVDEIKIDRSFVMDMASRADDVLIVQSVIDLAHNLGLHVTAEGVEDHAVAATLSRLGCDLAQGYYFGRPAPAPAALRRGDVPSVATRGVA